MATALALTPAQELEFITMESKAQNLSSIEVFKMLANQGLSQEVIVALKELSMKTAKTIAGKTIAIGKIIIQKIIEFIDANKGVILGIAIGAALGALVGVIPFIGPLLTTITIPLGAAAGAFMISGAGGAIKAAKDLATAFFKMMMEVFEVIFDKKVLS